MPLKFFQCATETVENGFLYCPGFFCINKFLANFTASEGYQ